MKTHLEELQEEILGEVIRGYDRTIETMKDILIIDIKGTIELAIRKYREAIEKDIKEIAPIQTLGRAFIPLGEVLQLIKKGIK